MRCLIASRRRSPRSARSRPLGLSSSTLCSSSSRLVSTSRVTACFHCVRSSATIGSGSKAGSPLACERVWCNFAVRLPSVFMSIRYCACGFVVGVFVCCCVFCCLCVWFLLVFFLVFFCLCFFFCLFVLVLLRF